VEAVPDGWSWANREAEAYMEGYQLALLLKPLGLLLMMVCIVAPLKWLFIRFFPNGRVKTLLLKETNRGRPGTPQKHLPAG